MKLMESVVEEEEVMRYLGVVEEALRGVKRWRVEYEVYRRYEECVVENMVRCLNVAIESENEEWMKEAFGVVVGLQGELSKGDWMRVYDLIIDVDLSGIWYYEMLERLV